MVDTQPSKISLDNIQGLVDRIPRGIPLPMNKSAIKITIITRIVFSTTIARVVIIVIVTCIINCCNYNLFAGNYKLV